MASDGVQDKTGKITLPQRKERAEALKSLREAAAQSPQSRIAGSGPSNAGSGPSNAGRGGGKERQRKVLLRIYKVLTQTPQDARGYVDGTQFTVTGVEGLMTLLNERAEDENKPGFKAARKVRGLISAQEEDTDVIATASVDRLQKFSHRIDGLKKRRKNKSQN